MRICKHCGWYVEFVKLEWRHEDGDSLCPISKPYKNDMRVQYYGEPVDEGVAVLQNESR